MKEILRQLIIQAVEAALPGAEVPPFALEHPDNDQFGDYSTNIALLLAKVTHQNPQELAEKIVAHFPTQPTIEKIEAVRPGFINITLKAAYFLEQMTQWPLQLASNKEQILFEFGQPNTHKLPHIGHLYSYCYGESCASLLEAVGNTVHRVNYQGDVGLHVAKCLWAYRQNSQPDPDGLAEKVAYLQECYQRGAEAYESDQAAKAAIDELNRLIYQQDSAVAADWQKTRAWSVECYEQFEGRLGIDFDKYYFESQVSQLGLQTVREQIGPVFEEDGGAVIFRGEPHGLHTRVFINQLGLPTYEAKDVGLAAQKLRDWQFDRSVVTTAVEQNDYWRVLTKTIELVLPEYVGKLKHIGFGMINLTTGKMSSRTGQIVTAFSLVEMVKERVRAYIQENRQYTADETERIAEVVAIGAIKYSFLRSSAGKNITFDLDSSIAFDGNSGPYLQYTYARCRSLFRKAGPLADDRSESPSIDPATLNAEELAVLRYLCRFSETVEAAAADYAPHVLCNYLFELAQRYSYFYNQHQVVSDDQAVSQFRLRLTAEVAGVLLQGLQLLGIEVLEQI